MSVFTQPFDEEFQDICTDLQSSTPRDCGIEIKGAHYVTEIDMRFSKDKITLLDFLMRQTLLTRKGHPTTNAGFTFTSIENLCIQ